MQHASPVKPSATPHAYDDIPVARPVGDGYIPPSSTTPSADFTTGGFFANAIRLCIFHLLNSGISSIGFIVVAVGTLGSILLLPLCCFGVITFRLVLFLVGIVAELDVSLYNFISPPNEQVYLSMPRQTNFFEFSGLRLAPNLSSFSHGALLVALYLSTVKFVIGLLSSIALSIAISFPLSALSDEGVQNAFFINFVGVIGFVIITSLLLMVGVACMKLTAGLSRAATRYFCCETFSTYQYLARANAYPTAVPTYGTARQTDERVIV